MKNRITLACARHHGSRTLDRRARRLDRAHVEHSQQADGRTAAHLGAGQQEPDHRRQLALHARLHRPRRVRGLLRSRLAAADRHDCDDRVHGCRDDGGLRDARTDRSRLGDQRRLGLCGVRGRVPSHRRHGLHRGGALAHGRSSAAVAVLAFRHAVLPRWWGALTALVAVVALIGPIGWAALVWGFPVWVLVQRRGSSVAAARRRAASPVTAAA